MFEIPPQVFVDIIVVSKIKSLKKFFVLLKMKARLIVDEAARLNVSGFSFFKYFSKLFFILVALFFIFHTSSYF
jgi:hypothetical protein